MGRKNKRPAYFAGNIARQAQRRCRGGKKSENKRVNDNRQAAAEVIALCFLAAINERYGIGEERLNRAVDAANAVSERFELNKKAVGPERAKKQLDEEVGGLLPQGFLLPATRTPKTSRDWALLSEQREAAEIAVKFFVVGTHKALGFGQERIAEVVKGTEENFRRFGEYAESGDYYGYVMLVRKVKKLLGGTLEIDESEADEPIFGRSIY